MKNLVLLFFALSSLCVHAQQKIIAMSVEANAPVGDTTQYGIPTLDSNTVFATTMNVILGSTDDIYQVHVKLGNTLHGTQYLSASFDYNVDGTFGTTTYSQTGNIVTLGLGNHIGMINYYAEVQIERADHSLQNAVLFSNN